jgi:hypothetical protein
MLNGKTFCNGGFYLVTTSLIAQSFISGDSSIANNTNRYLASIYGTQDTTIYYLSRRRLIKIPSYGSKLFFDLKDHSIQRIGISSMTGKGELSEEYWFKNNQLIFVYQTLEYFNESGALSNNRNFKGLVYWETRFYLEKNRLVFEKTTGIKDPGSKYHETDLFREKNRLLKIFKPDKL